MHAPAAALDAPLPIPHRAERATAVAVVILLLLLAVQGWAPQLLTGRATTERGGGTVAVDTAADRARHHVRPGPGGSLAVTGEGYRAAFDAAGLSYRPEGSVAALGISLSGIERGDSPLPLRTGTWEGRANVAERAVASGVTERVTSRAGEVEWDVVLDEAPAGTGPLTVGAALTGTQGEPVREADAWRLRLVSGAEVRLGELVVKDAEGTELLRRLPRVDGVRIELEVPESVLQRAAYPLTIDPTVGAAKRVSGPGKRDRPDVAFDGTNHLVVWEDERGTTGKDIFAARIRASDGVNLNPGGIPVATDTREERYPKVAWNGTVFLVVWELQHSARDEDVRAQRVLPNGTKTGGQLTVSDTSSSQFVPDVASNGSSFQVVWQDNTGGGASQIWGKRIAGNGTDIDESDGHRVVQSELILSSPALAWNRSAGAYLVAYQVFRGGSVDVDTARIIDGNGANPVASPADQPDGESEPAVASDGTSWLVTWTRGALSSRTIQARRVDAGGALIGTTIPLGSGNVGTPDVAYNGAYYVTWASASDIRAARVDSGGGLPDTSSGFPVSATAANEVLPAVTNGRSGGVGVAYQVGGSPSASIDYRSVTNSK